MRHAFAVLILAAGASRRLGRPKALVSLGGRTLIERAVDSAEALDPGWIGVVVGASAARIAAALRTRAVTRVHARRWREGLGASLRAGLQAVPRGARRVLVLTVDQWAIRPRDLRRLLAAAPRGPVASAYAGTRGVPALLPLAWTGRIRRLGLNAGAQSLLEATAAPMVTLEAAAIDLDTADELRALRRLTRRELNARLNTKYY
jgi:molybdenum cofactor cytidylyltransferase